MKVYYRPYSQNPDKHPLMPDGYPWELSYTPMDGLIEIDKADYDALAQSFDLTEYYNATRYVPESVLPRQFRQALVILGISIADIENAINSLPEPSKSLARIEWEYSLAFQRNNPFVSQVGYILNKTPSQLDDIWILASTL